MADVNVEDQINNVVSILSSSKVANALQEPQLQDAIHKLISPSYEIATIWALIATAAVAAISAILVWLQLRADHERSRRELAVNLLREWTTGLAVETAPAIRLVRTLNTDQCEKLVERESFTLDNTKAHRELVIACLEEKFPEITQDNQFSETSSELKLQISSKYSNYIRFLAVRYLNLLESIMAAWYESVAQPRIIEGQFVFLRSGKETDLKTFRAAFQKLNNADAFPCVTNFVANMQPRYGERPGFADAWPFHIRARG